MNSKAAEAFLRLCLRARRDPSARAALPAALVGLDFPAVVDRANAERVTPLVYHELKDLSLPAEIRERLSAIYYESARLNIVRFQQLERVLKALAERGIPVILLKGAALAEAIYGSLALRPMTDLDLLIPPGRVEEAVAAALELGYERTLGEAHTDTGLVEASNIQLILPGQNSSFLEIHWDVLHPPSYQGRVDPAWMWQTARPAQVGSCAVLLLSPEAQLLHLCAHLCLHHAGSGLLWQNDVAEVLAHADPAFDWELLLARAGEARLARALQIVLPVVVEELGAPAPPGMLARVAALPASRAEKRTFDLLMQPHQTGAQSTLAFMLELPGWRARLRYALSSVFPSPAYMRQRYAIPHPLLLPFYYLYRWVSGLIFRQ